MRSGLSHGAPARAGVVTSWGARVLPPSGQSEAAACESWWVGLSGRAFSQAVEREAPRMRASRIGGWGGLGAGGVDE